MADYQPPGASLLPLLVVAVIVAAYCELRERVRERSVGDDRARSTLVPLVVVGAFVVVSAAIEMLGIGPMFAVPDTAACAGECGFWRFYGPGGAVLGFVAMGFGVAPSVWLYVRDTVGGEEDD